MSFIDTNNKLYFLFLMCSLKLYFINFNKSNKQNKIQNMIVSMNNFTL